ncbi:hypothetical protein F4778DRAFT_745349 [Xylariomycetidae sp. FL2044]|nr:hypothetical protein F4778DRAFT_745349 [Xylariomycetidae sp. FL2044]
MKFLSTLMGVALIATGVSAQQAVVTNNCTSTVYVQSFPQDGSAAGALTTLAPGGRFAEDFVVAGSTVKVALDKLFTGPLFFGYSFSVDSSIAYYELSTEWGNPFADSHNILTPGAGCQVFDCAPDDAECYSTPASKKVYECPQPVNLEADLCVA